MEKMYQDYKDMVEFRLVYIKEAHASDGSRPVGYAEELGITEHKNYGQRCQTAEKLITDKSLTIPTLIDDMDDNVNKDYKAHPDRVFLVRKDGRLAVAAKRGPFGFKPAINKAKAWLASYKETGVEPEIVIEPESDGESVAAKVDPKAYKPVVGVWDMTTDSMGSAVAATMSITIKDDHVYGTWKSQGREMKLTNIKFEDGKLSFKRVRKRGPALNFVGTVVGNKVTGTYTTPFSEFSSSGERQSG